MTFAPAPPNTGLVFRVPGPDGDVLIPALVEHAVPAEDLVRATTLAKDGVTVHTVEHVLSALSGLGITNCEIRLEGGEPPVPGCGSALSYVQMIDEAGIAFQGLPAPYYKINRTVSWRRGDVELVAEPADHFKVSFVVDYDEPSIGYQEATFEIRPTVYRREIAPARTFALAKDVDKLREMGLALGGSYENALVFGDGKLAEGQELRFPDECVRHKILDLLGDLALLGMPIQGHVRARLSGHAANVEFARVLARTERRMPRIYPAAGARGLGHRLDHGGHAPPLPVPAGGPHHRAGARTSGWWASRTSPSTNPSSRVISRAIPIMPAVLIIEAMAQTGGVLLLSSVEDARGKLVYFSGIDEARFRQPVTPGDQLRFELEMIKMRGAICKMRGTAWVGDAKVAEADLMSTIVDS